MSMALSACAGQRPALLSAAQRLDVRAYLHELFGSLEVVHFFLVTARCGCFMQAARSLHETAATGGDQEEMHHLQRTEQLVQIGTDVEPLRGTEQCRPLPGARRQGHAHSRASRRGALPQLAPARPVSRRPAQ
ncbi:hypothetical protein LJG06_32830, partial [Pseudomonas aeruginosa]|nr:hypothetical protein [Pseudomonas aeruginosa]